MILGLHPVAAGRVEVLGAEPGRHNARVGYLPQRRAFDPSTRIRGVDLVRLGGTATAGAPRSRRWLNGRRARETAERVDEVIALVGAQAYAHRPIGQCSGGEQQRLLIAQALIRRPDLLVLDEPLDSLDVTNQASVSALIQQVCRDRQVAVLLVAHDVNPILPYLDQVIYLAHGGAVMGPPSEVINAETLTMLYGTPGRRPADRAGRLVVVGQPDVHAGHLDERAYLEPARRRAADAELPVHGQCASRRHVVAVVAGAIGYFMVLRRQSFAGHTLARHRVSGRGRRGLAGVERRGRVLSVSALPAPCPRRPPATAAAGGAGLGGFGEESAAIGTVQAFALACGFLFVSLYRGFLSDLNSLLFGCIIGVTVTQVRRPGCRRPDLPGRAGRHRASAAVRHVDPDVAQARGLPVRRAVDGVPGAAGRRRGRDESGYGQPAGVRPAGRAGRGRVRLTARPARGSRAVGRASPSPSPGSGRASRSSRPTRSGSG